MQTAAIILAAGAGTRMKSKKPKVAHLMLGKPLVNWVIDAAREAGIDKLATVVGHMREQVEPLVQEQTAVVIQVEQRGTADAVMSCAQEFADFDGSLLVLSGDCPLITARTMSALADLRERNDAVDHAEQSIVSALSDIRTRMDLRASLTVDDGTRCRKLTVCQLCAQTL